jgi:hypothetical protein
MMKNISLPRGGMLFFAELRNAEAISYLATLRNVRNVAERCGTARNIVCGTLRNAFYLYLF